MPLGRSPGQALWIERNEETVKSALPKPPEPEQLSWSKALKVPQGASEMHLKMRKSGYEYHFGCIVRDTRVPTIEVELACAISPVVGTGETRVIGANVKGRIPAREFTVLVADANSVFLLRCCRIARPRSRHSRDSVCIGGHAARPGRRGAAGRGADRRRPRGGRNRGDLACQASAVPQSRPWRSPRPRVAKWCSRQCGQGRAASSSGRSIRKPRRSIAAAARPGQALPRHLLGDALSAKLARVERRVDANVAPNLVA